MRKREDLQRERDELIRQKTQAEQLKARVMADGIIDEAELPKLSQAQLIIELAAPRIKRCDDLIREIEHQVQRATSDASAELNREVRKLRLSVEDRIAATNAPLFGGSVEKARRSLIRDRNIPFDVLRSVERAHWSGFCGGDQAPDAIYRLAVQFLRHVGRLQQEFPELKEK